MGSVGQHRFDYGFACQARCSFVALALIMVSPARRDAPSSHSPSATLPMPTFLITGASTGIGPATARHAAQAGSDVVHAARSEDKHQALASEIDGLGVRCDVTEWADQEALV